MAIAFQAFLLLLLFFPGAVFFLTFASQPSNQAMVPALTGSFRRNTAVAVASGAVLHLLWLCAIAFGTFEGIPFKTAATQFFILLSSSQQTDEYRAAVGLVGGNLGPMSAYFFTISVGGIVFGAVCRSLIERNRWDRRWPWLRFKPAWYYLLNGEDYEGDELVIIRINLLTEINGKPVLYSGLVNNHWYDDDGSLDVILIKNVTREWVQGSDEKDGVVFWRTMPRTETSESGQEQTNEAEPSEPEDAQGSKRRGVVVPVSPSDVFAIRFKEVKNVSIEYLKIELEK